MVTCKECVNCRIHVGYWLCFGGGEKRVKRIDDLEIEGMEKCPYFTRKITEVVKLPS